MMWTPAFRQLCRRIVRGSLRPRSGQAASLRTVLPDRKFRYLAARPELVEGLRGKRDTVSEKGEKKRGSFAARPWNYMLLTIFFSLGFLQASPVVCPR